MNSRMTSSSCLRKSFPLFSNNTEEVVYMQIGGAKYSDFIKHLEIIKKQSNAPSLCAQFWAFISASHSKSHTVDHKEYRMTASQFCSEANLKALGKKHKYIREIDNVEEIKIIFSKPLKSTQKKESKDESKFLFFSLMKDFLLLLHFS